MTSTTALAANSATSAQSCADALQECQDLRDALARVVSLIDRGQSSIYRALQDSASIRNARAKLQQHGVRT